MKDQILKYRFEIGVIFVLGIYALIMHEHLSMRMQLRHMVPYFSLFSYVLIGSAYWIKNRSFKKKLLWSLLAPVIISTSAWLVLFSYGEGSSDVSLVGLAAISIVMMSFATAQIYKISFLLLILCFADYYLTKKYLDRRPLNE